MVNLPPSLTASDLAPLWHDAARRLERNGLSWRGRMNAPDMSPQSRLAVESLVGRRFIRQLHLADLETGLARAGLGPDLAVALAQLGHPVSPATQLRRQRRAENDLVRQAVRDSAAPWPEPWASEWAESLIRGGILAGMDHDAATQLVASSRKVLDALGRNDNDRDRQPVSRVGLAAEVTGNAHALDRGTRLGRAMTKALTMMADIDERDVWEQAGAHADLVSGAALTWNLPVAVEHPLSASVATSTALGLPFVFTQLALRSVPVTVTPGSLVVAVENPRVLEYAAQRHAATAVVCTNGNPSNAVRMLLQQLLASGADVAYHGDFDAPGLAICARMIQLGLRPWQMTTAAYEQAVAAADAAGVELPESEPAAVDTPWDPELTESFNRHLRIVHEERLLDTIVT